MASEPEVKITLRVYDALWDMAHAAIVLDDDYPRDEALPASSRADLSRAIDDYRAVLAAATEAG